MQETPVQDCGLRLVRVTTHLARAQELSSIADGVAVADLPQGGELGGLPRHGMKLRQRAAQRLQHRTLVLRSRRSDHLVSGTAFHERDQHHPRPAAVVGSHKVSIAERRVGSRPKARKQVVRPEAVSLEHAQDGELVLDLLSGHRGIGELEHRRELHAIRRLEHGRKVGRSVPASQALRRDELVAKGLRDAIEFRLLNLHHCDRGLLLDHGRQRHGHTLFMLGSAGASLASCRDAS